MNFHGGQILLLDRSIERRRLISSMLAARGHDVSSDSATLAAAAGADTSHTDVVVVQLTHDDPADMIALLRRSRPVRVVYLAPPDSTKWARIEASRAGADRVFTEPVDLDELVAHIEAMLAWRRDAEGVLRVLDLVIDLGEHTVVFNDVEVALTLTEFKLLESLVRNVGMVMSKRNLLEEVWGFGGYDPNVVEVHVSSLRRKLQRVGPSRIETVRGVGYVIRDRTRPRRFAVAS